MPTLADYYDSAGGDYLPAGQHEVTISGVRFFTYNSGGPGVEYILADRLGRTTKLGSSLKHTAWWKIAQLAKACGMSKDECAKFDPSNRPAHNALIGRRLIVDVEQNAKGFHEPVAMHPCEPFTPQAPQAPQQTAERQYTDADVEDMDNDDLPF